VAGTCGHQDREPGLDATLNGIKHSLAFALLHPEKLIELVDLCTNFFTGLEAHHDELQFFAVYKTVRNVVFCSAAFSILWT